MMPKLWSMVKPTSIDRLSSNSGTIDRPMDGAGALVTSGWASISISIVLSEEARQRLAAGASRCVRHEYAWRQVEAVKGTRPDVQLGRNAGADQAVGVFDILVDEEVECGSADKCRRQFLEIG